MAGADQGGDVGRERRRGQWPGRHDDRTVEPARNGRNLLAHDGNTRVGRDQTRHLAGKALPVHRQRRAGRNPAHLGGAHHHRPEPAHFFLQHADGVIQLVAAERVAADQLRELIGLVHVGRADRTHLVQHDRHARRRSLPRRFAAGETAADDVKSSHDSLPDIPNRPTLTEALPLSRSRSSPEKPAGADHLPLQLQLGEAREEPRSRQPRSPRSDRRAGSAPLPPSARAPGRSSRAGVGVGVAGDVTHPSPSRMSSAVSTILAPSLSRPCEPRLRPDRTLPGTAMTSRPCSAA